MIRWNDSAKSIGYFAPALYDTGTFVTNLDFIAGSERTCLGEAERNGCPKRREILEKLG